MKRIELDTAIFDFIAPNILRVRVFEGVEIDTSISEQYRGTIAELALEPTGLLVDKQNQYSLTFNAQKTFLSNLPNIVATALLVHSSFSATCAALQLPILSTNSHNVEIFRSQGDAIHWLKCELTNS